MISVAPPCFDSEEHLPQVMHMAHKRPFLLRRNGARVRARTPVTQRATGASYDETPIATPCGSLLKRGILVPGTGLWCPLYCIKHLCRLLKLLNDVDLLRAD